LVLKILLSGILIIDVKKDASSKPQF